MTDIEIVQSKYPSAKCIYMIERGYLILIFNCTINEMILGRGQTESAAWFNARNRIFAREYENKFLG